MRTTKVTPEYISWVVSNQYINQYVCVGGVVCVYVCVKVGLYRIRDGWR